jgi:carbon monoxide dehydrogenase subunit G
MRIVRTVEVDRPLAAVFAYLSDFTTTTEWDPGTVTTVLVAGDGDVGTTYRNVSSFLGRETELTYAVTDRRPGELIALRGENRTVVARDTMEFARQPDGGTRVTYTADFAFKGLSRLVAPLLGPAFRRLGDRAEHGLRRSLAALDSPPPPAVG